MQLSVGRFLFCGCFELGTSLFGSSWASDSSGSIEFASAEDDIVVVTSCAGALSIHFCEMRKSGGNAVDVCLDCHHT